MSLEEIVFCISVYLYSAIPFENILPWFFSQAQDIESKLDKPSILVHLSKAPYIRLLVQLINLSKGYLPLWIAGEYYGNTILLFIVVPLVLVGHNWSFLMKFRSKEKFAWVIWGIYIYIYPPLGFVFPIIFWVLSFVFNSFKIGFLATIFTMFFIFWFYLVESYSLTLNFLIFLVVFFAFFEAIFRYFDGNKESILNSYRKRLN